MPQLRLTLLVVGLLFLVGLAWWELRRPHQVRGSDLPRPAPDPAERPPERTADWDLPRMSARDPEEDLPVLEVSPGEFAAFEARAETAPAPEDIAERTEEIPQDDFAADFTAPEAHFIDTRFGEDFADELDLAPALAAEPVVAAEEPPPGPVTLVPETANMDGLLEEIGRQQLEDPPISDIEVGSPQEQQPVSAPAPPGPADAPPAEVIVEWPAPEASRVLAVRVISVGEKFSGRAVRLALAAEGFVLGKFAIFHKPGDDGRALLSIASLNKPGTFDSGSIDMQRYGGLNLFAVLPGPLPGPEAGEELLACAQLLAQRLGATLQDEQGMPLGVVGIAALRRQAAAAPP
ncbi:MAG TPA: cell division protein ZipA C-terminal FtsZ-binding domain-containing protein [Steroidobacteraceae bacterium]|nr:cell division protein ZipA C-terminal FtsZ-binding domain-containing protein [Steroidobacteraceae bacterium]